MRIKRFDEKVLDKELPRRIIAQNTALLQKILDSILQKKGGPEVCDLSIQETFDLIEELPCNVENRISFQDVVRGIRVNSKSDQWC